MAETSYINKIAFAAAAETAPPTAATKGSNVSDWTGFTTMGSIQAGDDYDADEGDLKISFFDNVGEVHPPRSLTREASVMFQNGVDSLSIPAYDGQEGLLGLCSDITAASNKSEKAASITYRTVIVEVDGLWMDVFPKCRISLSDLSESYAGKKPATAMLMIKPHATTDYPGGWYRVHYQA